MAKHLTITTLDGKEEYKYRVRKDNGKYPSVGQCVETEKSYYIYGEKQLQLDTKPVNNLLRNSVNPEDKIRNSTTNFLAIFKENIIDNRIF